MNSVIATRAAYATLILLLALGFGQAQAATYNLNLLGTVSSASISSFDSGATHYDNGTLSLSGLDALNAITVAVGDTIQATVTLDQSVTIPASVDTTWLTFGLGGSNFPAIDTGTFKDAVAFFNHGVAGLSGADSNCSTTGRLVSCNLFNKPNNPSITFDQAVMSFEIEWFDAPPGQTVTLDNASISYTLFSPAAPVPEPETYAMLLAGLGLIGGIARRRNSQK